jgi:transposase InsO family protein
MGQPSHRRVRELSQQFGKVTEGLSRLGIVHEKTLPYSPYQNGKQESFWGNLEGRLLEMLDGLPDLTLAFLNEATQFRCASLF